MLCWTGMAGRVAAGMGARAACGGQRAVAKRLGMTRVVKRSGYQLRRWSNTNSGMGAGASAQSGTGPGAWSHSGGSRAGATWGGLVGSPKWERMDGSAGARVIKAMMRISPPHRVLCVPYCITSQTAARVQPNRPAWWS